MSARRSVQAAAATIVCVGWVQAPTAQAQSYPAAQVEVGLWSTPGEQVDATGRLGLDLDERVRLEASWSRPLERPGRGFATGRVQVGRWRLAGGVLDRGAGLHLGVAPRLRVPFARWLAWSSSLDASLGAGWRLDHEPVDRDAGAVSYPPGVDVVAAAMRVGSSLSWRPWSPLQVEAGLYGRVVAAAAPPGSGQERGLQPYARYTDLGLSAALSRASGGGFGQVRMRLWQGRAVGGSWEVWARYREAWDWLYLDPLYMVLERGEGLGGYQLEALPPRVTRLGGLVLHGSLETLGLRLGLEARHVLDSTTNRDFADRPGWSLAASLGLRWGPLGVHAEGRYHLQDDTRTALLLAGTRLGLSVGAELELLQAAGCDVSLLGGMQLGIPDELGVVRDGQAWHAGLRVRFGGPRALARTPRWFPRPSGPRAGWGGRDPQRELGSAAGEEVAAADQVAAESAPALAAASGPEGEASDSERPVSQAQAQAALDLLPPGPLTDRLRDELAQTELPTVGEITAWIERHPEVVERVEARFPGVVDGLRELLAGGARAGSQAAIRPELVAGYGSGRIQLSLVQRRRASLFAITSRIDGRAVDHAETRRTLSLATDYAAQQRLDIPSQLPVTTSTHADLPGLLAAQGLESFSVLQVRRGRGRMVFQGETAWSRGMLYLLTGHSD